MIYEAALELQAANTAIDQLTVADRLHAAKRLEAVGGHAELERLCDQTTAAHAEYYLDILRQKHLLRVVIETAGKTAAACYDETQSAGVVLANAEQAFLNIADARSTSHAAPWCDVMRAASQHLNRLFKLGPGGLSGLPTGLANLDLITRGLRPAEMTILAARPSMGKTSLAMNIAECVAIGKNMFGHPFAGDHARPRRHGTARPRPTPQKTPARRTHRHRLPPIIELPRVRPPGPPTRNLRHLRKPQSNGQELNIPVLVLSQLSRAPEQRDKSGKPKLSDLRDSGDIEQDADMVLLLRRTRRRHHRQEKRLVVRIRAGHSRG